MLMARRELVGVERVWGNGTHRYLVGLQIRGPDDFLIPIFSQSHMLQMDQMSFVPGQLDRSGSRTRWWIVSCRPIWRQNG